MNIKFQLVLECLTQESVKILKQCLEPENKELDGRTIITMNENGNHLIIDIKSSASLPSFRFTVDDIMHHLSLLNSVVDVVDDKTL